MAIYISTEIIVPKEFKLLKLNDSSTHIVFNYTQNSEVVFKVTNLTTINQFILPKLHPIFTDLPYDRIVVDLEYEVLDKEQRLLFSDMYTYRHTASKGIFANKKVQTIFLPYIFNLKEDIFYFTMRIKNKEMIEKNISSFEIRVESNNEQFFYFFLGLKFVLFFISIITFVNFFKRYYMQIRQTRETEQKLVLVVSVLLIAYNLPFNFYLNYINPSIGLLLISSLVNILFYSYICYIWMVTFEVILTDYLERKVNLS